MKKPLLETFWFRTFLPAALVLAVVIAMVCPISCCSTDTYGIEILQGDFSCPQIGSISVLSSSSVQMVFSKVVEVLKAEVYIADTTDTESESLGAMTWQVAGDTVTFSFEGEAKVGVEYVLEGTVEDLSGNTLTFAASFTGYNDNPARLVINELRNVYTTRSISDVKVHCSEFVELYVLKAGNLSGFEIYSANDGDSKSYQFPAIDVSEGEYITVHMRTIASPSSETDGEGMVSETEDDLTLSTHEDSCDTARDLWNENNSKAVFADSDIVVLRNTSSGEVVDAILFAKSATTTWDSDYADVLNAVEESGVWQGGLEPADSLCVDYIKTAYTRSCTRKNLSDVIKAYENADTIPNSAENWIVATPATPGYENSQTAYEP